MLRREGASHPQSPETSSSVHPTENRHPAHSRSRDLIVFNLLHSSAPETDFRTDTPHFPVLHFRMLHKYLLFFFLNQLKVCGNPALSRSIGGHFPSSVCSLWATVGQFSQPSRRFHHDYYRICNGDVRSVFDVTATIR